MTEFKTNLKVNISINYRLAENNKTEGFSTIYTAPVKRVIIDRKMRAPKSRMKSRFIDERMKNDEN